MSEVQLIDAAALGQPGGHYSHAARAGGLVFISGQLPITPQGDKLGGETFEVQAAQVLSNLDEVLGACGCERHDLVQVRVYLLSVEDWPRFNALYAEWIGDHRPARCVVPVPALHYGLALEIEAVAQAGR
ncbi:RidA family protein [Deinococcus irradiatisoli]|uniref:RidA family protein n=1 Tax=Deinococcus irradiatisoli TaxID=2202254 RepID=A0A2Z3JJQ0_9DEIO|nr:RidA family protein [Deinococcus irradiatisoli]AWN23801.1 RidA family protein [Deinococcus irradiatisoli]